VAELGVMKKRLSRVIATKRNLILIVTSVSDVRELKPAERRADSPRGAKVRANPFLSGYNCGLKHR
jgi:hypothetical protein